MKKIVTSLILVILFFGLSRAFAQNTYTVVLSMDGFRWDYTNYANTPTLDSLSKVGVSAFIEPCFPSLTFPNHYSMATGLHPDKHGIVNNSFWDKQLDREFAISNRNAVEDSIFWKGEPIWITAQKQGLKTASFFWPGTEVKGKNPDYWKRFDSTVPYINRADTVIKWLNLPLEERPQLIMWYIEEPDGTGHHFGPTSQELISKVEQLDSILGYYFDEARKLPHFDQINFIVTTDHGMSKQSGKLINLYKLLDTSRLEKVVPTSPFMILYPQEDYTEEVYRILRHEPHINVWRRNEVPAEYHYGTNLVREGAIIIMADLGYYIGLTETEPSIPNGSHGFDPNHPDMRGIFLASGPGFQKSYQHPIIFKTLNLYNIVAKSLNILPAYNHGKLYDIDGLFR